MLLKHMDTEYKLSLDHKLGSILNQLAEKIFYPKVTMLSTVDIGWNFEIMPTEVTDKKVLCGLLDLLIKFNCTNY